MHYKKMIRRLRLEEGDLVALSSDTFDEEKKINQFMKCLADVHFGKIHVGVVVVKDVHDDISIKKGIIKSMERKLAEQNEGSETVQQVQKEDTGEGSEKLLVQDT